MMDTLFLHILNTAITAGWLVLTVILARLLLKRAPAWMKCALWAIVAVRLVWPFSFESVLSLLPSAETIAPSQLYVAAPQVTTGIPSLNAAINPVFTQTFQADPMNSVNPLQVSLWIGGWVWVLGMFALALYGTISYLRIRRRVCVSVPAEKGVYLCDRIPAPFILGIIKPKIYLPANLSKEKWDNILAHERAHLDRRDHWWKPLAFALLTVFWFHPLLWVAYILLCRDVELACDERVIKALSAEEKQVYSNTLLECSIPGRWITACPLAFGETGVKQRIKAVLHYKKPTLWILIVAITVCTVLTVGFLTDPKGKTITQEDVVGKTYIYEKEGAGGDFSITIGEDYVFQYYEGVYSSHLGFGNWEMKDEKLYLHDRALKKTRTFVFTVQEDCLVFCEAESDQFTYVDVLDGDIFRVAEPIIPEQSGEMHLMWVQVLRCEKDYLYVRDGDGICWKVLAEDVDADDFILEHCWVSYYGEPTQINEWLSDDLYVQHQVTAQKCWTRLESVPGIEKENIFLPYDFCVYDIDEDGITEVCVLSAGHTSGVSTFIFSVWENGVCEHEKWVYERQHSYSAAFVRSENGLCAVNSVGCYFYFTYANGTILVNSEGWMQ